MEQKSSEQQSMLDLMGIEYYTFNERPIIEHKMWENLQGMHKHTLAMSLVLNISATAVQKWVTVVDTILHADAPWGNKHFVQSLMLQADSLPDDRQLHRLTANNV